MEYIYYMRDLHVQNTGSDPSFSTRYRVIGPRHTRTPSSSSSCPPTSRVSPPTQNTRQSSTDFLSHPYTPASAFSRATTSSVCMLSNECADAVESDRSSTGGAPVISTGSRCQCPPLTKKPVSPINDCPRHGSTSATPFPLPFECAPRSAASGISCASMPSSLNPTSWRKGGVSGALVARDAVGWGRHTRALTLDGGEDHTRV